jgi:DNA adenine methylase
VQQLSFLESSPPRPLDAIVNVASVPQRSPFRYPGGKTWLVPRVRTWLASLPVRPRMFIEPFAGGGIVSLTVAFERLADHVIMVERDPQVAAVWRTILEGDAQWLAKAVAEFDLNEDTLTAALERTATSTQELAFQTILKNRTYRGGILAPGAGRIKNGENGKGLLSRWYPGTIRHRILEIAEVRERITFIEGDGLEVARQHAADPTVVYFIDPPYTASTKRAGSRLYLYSEIDHEELFRIATTFTGDFLMTYDNADALHALADAHGFDTELVAMKNTHHAEMTELLIGRDLDWARLY